MEYIVKITLIYQYFCALWYIVIKNVNDLISNFALYMTNYIAQCYCWSCLIIFDAYLKIIFHYLKYKFR